MAFAELNRALSESNVFRWALAGCCVYEAGALLLRKYPTISSLSWDHPVLVVLIMSALLIHLLTPLDQPK